MDIVTVSSKGQLVLPKQVRDSLGIKAKQKLFVRIVKNHIEIELFPENPIEYLCGIFKDYPGSLTKDLLEERKKELEHEENIAGFIRHSNLLKARRRIPKNKNRADQARRK